MRLTKIISSVIKKGITVIKVLGYGSKDVQNVTNIAPFGIDANPLPGYRGIYADTGSKEDKVLIGVIFEDAIAQPGELRLHSENDSGDEVASFYLKKDGKVEANSVDDHTINTDKNISLNSGEDIKLNGDSDNMMRYTNMKNAFDTLKNDFNNFLTAYNAHVHTGVTTGGGSSGPPPTPGTPSSADMSSAKIDNVKTN